MQRNLNKAIEQGHVIVRNNLRLDITVPELLEIMEMAEKNCSSREALYNGIRYGYLIGLAVGYRNGGADHEEH